MADKMLQTWKKMIKLIPKSFTRCLSRLVTRIPSTTGIPCGQTTMNSKYSLSQLSRHSMHSKVGSHQKPLRRRSLPEVMYAYVTLKYEENRPDTLATLDFIMKFVRISAKESLLLVRDAHNSRYFSIFLKEVQDFLDNSPQHIVDVLCCLAEISERQNGYLNRSGVEIYPKENSKKLETHPHLPNVFLRYESYILTSIADIPLHQLLVILNHFNDNNLGSKEFFVKIWNWVEGLRTEDLTLDNIVQIISCVANLKGRFNPSKLMFRMKRELRQRGLVALSLQQLAEVAHSFAVSETSDSVFSRQLKDDILSRDIRKLNPTEKNKILFSFIKAYKLHGLDVSDLMKEFEDQLLRKGLRHFDVSGVAVIAWVFTSAERCSKDFLTYIRNNIQIRGLRLFTSNDVTVICKAFANVRKRVSSERLFLKFVKELVYTGFDSYSNFQVTTLLMAFTQTGYGTVFFYDCIKADILKRKIEEFLPIELTQTVWCFAKLREKIDVRDFFLNVNYDLRRLSLRQLTLIGWSYAAASVTSGDMPNKIKFEISQRDFSHASNMIICQMMYALASFGDAQCASKQVKCVEDIIFNNKAKLLDNRQLSLLVFSFGELHTLISSPDIFLALEEEMLSRSLERYMPADICRFLWGFSQVKHLMDITFSFRSLTKYLLRLPDWRSFTVPHVTMVTVAMSTAKQWDSRFLKKVISEIVGHPKQNDFNELHLCSFADSFASEDPLETNEFFIWLEKEIIERDASTLPPEILHKLVSILVERKGTEAHFFQAVKEQLKAGTSENYTREELENICKLLAKTGINVTVLNE